MNELICAKLKEIRLKKGSRQGDLAALLNTTRQRYARMENGQVDISLSDLEKLASFYEIPLKELTGLMDRSKSFEDMLTEAIGEEPDPETKIFCQLIKMLKEEEDIYFSRASVRKMAAMPAEDSFTKKILASDHRRGKEEDFFLYPIGNEICGLRVNNTFGQNEQLLVINSHLSQEDRRFSLEIIKMSGEQESEPIQRLEVLRRGSLVNLKKNPEVCERVRRRVIPVGDLYQKIDRWFGLEPADLRILELVSLAEDFRVSTAYMIETLYVYHMIGEDRKKGLEKGLRYYTEERLRQMLGIQSHNCADKKTAFSDGQESTMLIPYYFIDHLLSNFEKGYIPFGLFHNVMKLCGINVDSLKALRKPMDDRDGWDDWDDWD